MITVNIREEDEFIKLGQALKKASLVGSGVDAKMVIQDGQVTVNGQVEVQQRSLTGSLSLRVFFWLIQADIIWREPQISREPLH